MSEQSSEHNFPSQQPEATTYQDEQVVQLLANPEVQQSLVASDAVVTKYYRDLEADGRTVKPILKGVTPTGDCVQVAEYSSSPDDFSVQGERPHRQYVVFAYPLSDIATPGVVDALTPRNVGYVRESAGSGINVDVAKSGTSFTVTYAHVMNAVAEGLGPDALKELSKASREQSANADKLHLPQVNSDSAKFNGQSIVTLEDAAFGSRRQAIVDEVIAPLVAKRKEHIHYKIKAIGTDPETEAREDAFSKELSGRIKKTVDIMRANPVMIDQAGPDLIYDVAKAEYIAHKVNAAKAEKAGQIATQAAAAYDADPLNVFQKRKGLFGRFGPR